MPPSLQVSELQMFIHLLEICKYYKCNSLNRHNHTTGHSAYIISEVSGLLLQFIVVVHEITPNSND